MKIAEFDNGAEEWCVHDDPDGYHRMISHCPICFLNEEAYPKELKKFFTIFDNSTSHDDEMASWTLYDPSRTTGDDLFREGVGAMARISVFFGHFQQENSIPRFQFEWLDKDNNNQHAASDNWDDIEQVIQNYLQTK
jgi:hypothetical protein|tara:strand:- start:186 stop:596 length:411 start_codon:yes stop_codon:yes gene_type:complete